MRSHRVVAPDLPGLGMSQALTGRLNASAMVAWLGDLIRQTCAEPPTLVGTSLGGALAARFAVQHGTLVRRIVLVNSGGLSRALPTPGGDGPPARVAALRELAAQAPAS